MPSDEPSNKQSVNTGLRSNRTTPALTIVGWGRACKLSWITGNIRIELKARAPAFKEMDNNPDTYNKSRYSLRRTNKQAKRQYRIKFGSYYTGSGARRMWQDLKTITDNKGKPKSELPSDTSLPDELNPFYARFEASNTEACI